MVHKEARSVVGVVGNVISGGLFLSPIPAFILIWRKKNVEAFDPKPYLTTKKDKRGLLHTLYVCELVFFGAIVVGTMLAIPEHKMKMNRHLRAVVVGFICDFFNVLMYNFTLFIVSEVIKTKSVQYMSLPLSVANFLNGCCWTSYALIGKVDYFILVSNGLGTIAGAIQLIVYAM
ncbi:putative SWEET sugar transporter [Rosa chinensis]|uniref:Putative SWEET sugar transporter n=1 Tax=Rosa chinensis TaxID=74649 RepID=A0A2P6Q9A2_ROSCH|nr:putative SWEET sugar transporter [Rosa chinensis]